MSTKKQKLTHTTTKSTSNIKSNDSTSKSHSTTHQHSLQYHTFNPIEIQQIRTQLVQWYNKNRRKLPWRGDPIESIDTTVKQVNHKQKLNNQHNNSTNKSITSFFTATNSKKSVNKASDTAVDDNDAQDNNSSDKAVAEHKSDSTIQSDTKTCIPPSAYGTWISEIMLQQTRVETVCQYWLKWMSQYPTIESLANATIDDVNLLWAGLGYYRRARFILEGARVIADKYNGIVPNTIQELLTIPGIGKYTAGAVVSIAYNKPAPIVDGNVIRILSRMRALDITPDSKPGVAHIWQLSNALIEECSEPSQFNQAMMELGATVCTSQTPLCHICPVQSLCHAYNEVRLKQRPINNDIIDITNSDDDIVEIDSTNDLCTICDIERCHIPTSVTVYPRKAIKTKQLDEYYACSVITRTVNNTLQYMMCKRPDTGLLAGQYEFVCAQIESDASDNERQNAIYTVLCELLHCDISDVQTMLTKRKYVGELSHVFSHRIHHMYVDTMQLSNDAVLDTISERIKFVNIDDLKSVPLTTGVKKVLQLVQ